MKARKKGSACGRGARALERLLRKRRRLAEKLLNLDMYDRWGNRSVPALNRELLRAEEYGKKLSAVERELEKRSTEAGPEAVREWARAHLALLEDFVSKRKGRKDQSTALFVARQELEAWRGVEERGTGFVDQNVYYIHYDESLYESYFGAKPAAEFRRDRP